MNPNPTTHRRPTVLALPDSASAIHSLEAERVLLGGVMVCPDVLTEPDVVAIQPGDFYSERHQRLWTLIRGMEQRGDVIEPLSVSDRVEAEGCAEDVGGFGYVAGLPDCVPAVDSVGYYARIVHQRATVRLVRTGAMELLDACGRGDLGLAELQTQAEQVAGVAAGRSSADDWQPVSEVAATVYETIERRAAAGGEEPGLPSGVMSDMVRAKGGQMCVLAGRPGMGKTGLAIEWSEHMAAEGVPNAIVSAEMPPPDLLIRRACKLAEVPAWRAEKGDVSAAELARIRDACATISELPQWWTNAPGLTVDAVRGRIYAMQRKADKLGTPLQAVFVDHIGKLHGLPHHKTDTQSQGYVSEQLAAMALRTGLCIIALCQLNRSVEDRPTHEPRMSDLRATGRIEEDARMVLMLYRPEYYDPGTPNPEMGKVIVAKQNGGKTGSLWLPFLAEYGSYDISRKAQPLHTGGGGWA